MLNHSILQATQEQDSKNRTDLNQELEFEDEFNTRVLNRIDNRAANRIEIEIEANNRADMAKRPEYRNGVIT